MLTDLIGYSMRLQHQETFREREKETAVQSRHDALSTEKEKDRQNSTSDLGTENQFKQERTKRQFEIKTFV